MDFERYLPVPILFVYQAVFYFVIVHKLLFIYLLGNCQSSFKAHWVPWTMLVTVFLPCFSRLWLFCFCAFTLPHECTTHLIAPLGCVLCTRLCDIALCYGWNLAFLFLLWFFHCLFKPCVILDLVGSAFCFINLVLP